MNWFFFALVAPALWSVTNHIDKYLLSKYVKGATPGALMLFSAVFGVFALPFIYLIDQNVLSIGLVDAILIITSGALTLLALIPYFYALDSDETSIVIPIFQTIPIFGFIYAYFVLGETLTTVQILASLLIITGAIAISLDLGSNMPKIKGKVLTYMLSASAILAGVDLLFKFVAINVGFWTGLFWYFIGYVLFFAVVLITIKTYRNQFLEILRKNRIPVIGLNAFNETLNLIARSSFGYASLLAPLALVQVVNGFQPFFVFLYGVILTLFLPQFGSESLLKKHLIQKCVAIAVIFIGTYILNS